MASGSVARQREPGQLPAPPSTPTGVAAGCGANAAGPQFAPLATGQAARAPRERQRGEERTDGMGWRKDGGWKSSRKGWRKGGAGRVFPPRKDVPGTVLRRGFSSPPVPSPSPRPLAAGPRNRACRRGMLLFGGPRLLGEGRGQHPPGPRPQTGNTQPSRPADAGPGRIVRLIWGNGLQSTSAPSSSH